MSAERHWFPIRRRRVEVEVEPQVVAEEMATATQRLRDQAWKINAATRTPLLPDETVRSNLNADSER